MYMLKMKIFQPFEFTSPFIPFFLTNLDFCSGEMSENVIVIIILCFRRRLFYFCRGQWQFKLLCHIHLLLFLHANS